MSVQSRAIPITLSWLDPASGNLPHTSTNSLFSTTSRDSDLATTDLSERFIQNHEVVLKASFPLRTHVVPSFMRLSQRAYPREVDREFSVALSALKVSNFTLLLRFPQSEEELPLKLQLGLQSRGDETTRCFSVSTLQTNQTPNFRQIAIDFCVQEDPPEIFAVFTSEPAQLGSRQESVV